jgi:hypothetical protein
MWRGRKQGKCLQEEKILVDHVKDGIHGNRKRTIGLILELEEMEEENNNNNTK